MGVHGLTFFFLFSFLFSSFDIVFFFNYFKMCFCQLNITFVFNLFFLSNLRRSTGYLVYIYGNSWQNVISYMILFMNYKAKNVINLLLDSLDN